MTERQAWLQMARDVRADIDGPWCTSGLCWYLDDYRPRLTTAAYQRIKGRIDAAVGRGRCSRTRLFGWPRNRRGDLARIAFCKRQVARIDRERRRKR